LVIRPQHFGHVHEQIGPGTGHHTWDSDRSLAGFFPGSAARSTQPSTFPDMGLVPTYLLADPKNFGVDIIGAGSNKRYDCDNSSSTISK
jgi:hypothetical protein